MSVPVQVKKAIFKRSCEALEGAIYNKIIGHASGGVVAAQKLLPYLGPRHGTYPGINVLVVALGDGTCDELDTVASAMVEASKNSMALAVLTSGHAAASMLRSWFIDGLVSGAVTIHMPTQVTNRVWAVAARLLERSTVFGRDAEVWISEKGKVTERAWVPAEISCDVRELGEVVVLGGAGGIGARVAEWLLMEGCPRVVIVDPSEFGSTQRERSVSANDRIERYSSVDKFRNNWSPLPSPGDRILIHCAGELRGGGSIEACRSMMPSKVQSVEALLHGFAGEFDRIVAFGSVTSLRAHKSLGAYGYVNEIMAGRLHGNPMLRGKVCVVHWDIWGEVGMAARMGADQQAAQMGIRPISAIDGLTVLRQVIARAPEVVECLVSHQ